MELLGFALLLVAFIAVGAVLVILQQVWGGKGSSAGSGAVAGQRSPYRRKVSFLTRSERVMYEQLLRVVPIGHTVFANVRVSDLVDISASGRDYWSAFGRISQKHVDFVLCDERYSPCLVVEVDGKSHESKKQQESDAVKDRVLNEVGLPLLRYTVGSQWDLSRVRQYLPEPHTNTARGGR